MRNLRSGFAAYGDFLRRLFHVSIVLSALAFVGDAISSEQSDFLPLAKPEEVGLSSERLQNIGQLIDRYIEKNAIPGAVTLVARKGHIAHFEARGVMDIETKKPMTKDALFRLTSTTKPVTATAILILMEEGKLRLSDPVSKYIPEFKGSQVAVAKSPALAPTSAGSGEPPSEPEFTVVPANRDITIQDLLTHTSGLAGLGGKIGGKKYAALRAARKPTEVLADFIPRLGSLPLDFHPGTKWRYSDAGFEVLARIVEIASGMTFDHFLRQRLFEPLGMKDTFFAVSEEKASQAVTVYRETAKGLEKTGKPLPLVATQHYLSGAGGLITTAEDFFRFGQMLCNGGELNGHRVLSPGTVELMTSNSVGNLFNGQIRRPPQGMGFGLGGEIVLDAATSGIHRSNGSYGWDGAYGTHWWVSRQEQLVVVFMIQVEERDLLHRDFENAVTQAIIE